MKRLGLSLVSLVFGLSLFVAAGSPGVAWAYSSKTTSHYATAFYNAVPYGVATFNRAAIDYYRSAPYDVVDTANWGTDVPGGCNSYPSCMSVWGQEYLNNSNGGYYTVPNYDSNCSNNYGDSYYCGNDTGSVSPSIYDSNWSATVEVYSHTATYDDYNQVFIYDDYWTLTSF